MIRGRTAAAGGLPPASAVLSLALSAAVTVLAAGRAAHAQDDVVGLEPPPVYVAALRPGGKPLIGFNAGVGAFNATCTDCYAQSGLSAGLFAGWQLVPRVALLFDGWALIHIRPLGSHPGGVVSHILTTAAARVWLAPRLWVEAGVGAGVLAANGSGAQAGPGALLALGAEPGHRPCHGIDVSVRIGASRQRLEGGGHALVYGVAGGIAFHWNGN